MSGVDEFGFLKNLFHRYRYVSCATNLALHVATLAALCGNFQSRASYQEMTKSTTIYVLLILSFCSCHQKNSEQKLSKAIISGAVKNDSFEKMKYTPDTTKIAILPLDTSYYQFKNSKATVLSNKDLQLTEDILIKCIENNNNNRDTSKHVLEYIDLRNYKRQYVPFINKRGEKLVWVNCFCTGAFNFPDWKKEIVMVNDGGSCFFNVIINLTAKKYGNLFINGYA